MRADDTDNRGHIPELLQKKLGCADTVWRIRAVKELIIKNKTDPRIPLQNIGGEKDFRLKKG